MKGTIEDFDSQVIRLVSQGKQHLIYKHAISTFMIDDENESASETSEE